MKTKSKILLSLVILCLSIFLLKCKNMEDNSGEVNESGEPLMERYGCFLTIQDINDNSPISGAQVSVTSDNIGEGSKTTSDSQGKTIAYKWDYGYKGSIDKTVTVTHNSYKTWSGVLELVSDISGTGYWKSFTITLRPK